MKLKILTLSLDSMPFIAVQFTNFQRLACDWEWVVIEGAAANTGSTKWCRQQAPRLSQDGTTTFLEEISYHPRVTYIRQEWWEGGKDQMCQRALDAIKEPCLLVQCDSDEIWTAEQLQTLLYEFETEKAWNCARFFCTYLVGWNIRTVGDNCYGSNRGEWLRAFRFTPGMRMLSHEPPVLEGVNDPRNECCMSREFSRDRELVFMHYAYVTEAQVAYKEFFYNYHDAVKHWRRLQANTVWPVKLKDFLPWVDDRVGADTLFKG